MTIEKQTGIPIPPYTKGKRPKFNFRDLHPGESILWPCKGCPTTSYWSLKTGLRYVTRRVMVDGAQRTRVWCI